MVTVQDAQPPRYRVIQLVWDAERGYRNEVVGDFDDLVTHHPNSNRGARIENGAVVGGQPGRILAVMGGEFQEVEVAREGRDFGLGPDQVLLKKDFILEDARLPAGPASRRLDVPSPVSGVVGAVNPRSGLVDVMDRQGGEVILRVRHMSPIHVRTGDLIEYGQALGVQGRLATAAVHVHMEVDTRYYEQYENYLDDLGDGRLAIDPGRRGSGIAARPVIDDGTIRIGESDEVVAQVQRALNAGGFQGVDGRPLPDDGVYRFSMQPAVLGFQQAHGLQQTGDLDQATLQRLAPPTFPPEVRRDGTDAPPSYFKGGVVLEPSEPLLQQAQDAVRRLDACLDREHDDSSARLAASAAWLAKASGLSRIDHVLLGQGTQALDRGSLFVVQGAMSDPAHLRAHMVTDEALARPVSESLARMQLLDAEPPQPVRMAHSEPAVSHQPRIA
ncbi:MAG: peptidoglycan-binding protein [Pseudomonadota bacterium]|nr:peptidoglycan-binding protein [Pseudomonadota bacterium]